MNTTIYRFHCVPEIEQHIGILRMERAWNMLCYYLSQLRKMTRYLHQSFELWQQAKAQAATDRRLWDLALKDAKMMADISRQMSRQIEK